MEQHGDYLFSALCSLTMIWGACAVASIIIGSRKDLFVTGLLMGVFFGPVGLASVFFMEGTRRVPCPECDAMIPSDARVCPECRRRVD